MNERLTVVYLRMKGIDPATHEVSPELDRIRTYYSKINILDAPESRTSSRIAMS